MADVDRAMSQGAGDRSTTTILRNRKLRTRLLLLTPALLLALLLLVLPVGRVLISSFQVTPDSWGLGNYSYLGQGVLLNAIVTTLLLTGWTVLAAIILGYPLAYQLATLPPRRAGILMVRVMLPFWTSMTVKATAFIILLGRQGPLNRALLGTGLIDEPLKLLFTALSVVILLAHIALPLMVLPCTR